MHVLEVSIKHILLIQPEIIKLKYVNTCITCTTCTTLCYLSVQLACTACITRTIGITYTTGIT